MKSYNANETAEYGIYYSLRNLDVRFVGADGEMLEGKAGVTYNRLPMALALAAGAVLGGAFVMAFPLIILAATFYGIFRVVANKVSAAVEKRAYLAMLRWEPVGSYLSGSRKDHEHKDGEDAAPAEATSASGDDLADLRDEVAERREREE